MFEGTWDLQTLCAKVEPQMKKKQLKQTLLIAQQTTALAVWFVFPAQILWMLFLCLVLSLAEIQQRRRVL
jgi:hypothetical protein